MEGNRLLDVMGLSRSRFPELSLLLQSEPPCGPPVAHTRKRANAHARRHRSRPKKISESTSNQNDDKETKQLSRKRRRRPQALLTSHSPFHPLDGDGGYVRWLETHIWHAKRMHMRTQWGWCFGGSKSDMGCAATIRAAQQRATVHDATYQTPIEISGTVGELVKTFALLGDPGSPTLTSSNLLRTLKILCGQREVETMTHKVGKFPRGIIGPMRVLLNPIECEELKGTDGSEEVEVVIDSLMTSLQIRKAWLFCHPSIVKHVKLELTSIEPNTVRAPQGGGLVRLEVRGFRASDVMKRISLLPSIPSTNTLQCDGDLIGVRVGDPRHLRFAGSSPHFSQGWTQEDGGDWAARRRKGRSSVPVLHSDEVKRSGVVDRCLSASEVDDVEDFWSDVRTETSTALSELKDHQINAVIHELRMKKANEEEIDSVSNVEIPILDIPSIVIRRQHTFIQEEESIERTTRQVSGYDILLPVGSALIFFNALVMSGCTALGMDEACALRSDAGLLNFPHEYPDSDIGHALWASGETTVHETSDKADSDKQKIIKPVKKTKKRIEGPSFIPPHVDVSWIDLFPFFSRQTSSSSSSSVMVARNITYVAPLFELPFPSPPVPILIPVRVCMDGKGVPRCGKALCVPLDISTPLPFNKQTLSNIKSKKRQTIDTNDSEDVSDEEEEGNVDERVNVAVIGYVTSGGYSAARGCGFGVAMCTVKGLQMLTRRGEMLQLQPLQMLQANRARVLIASVSRYDKTNQDQATIDADDLSRGNFLTASCRVSSIHNASVGLCCD